MREEQRLTFLLWPDISLPPMELAGKEARLNPQNQRVEAERERGREG